MAAIPPLRSPPTRVPDCAWAHVSVSAALRLVEADGSERSWRLEVDGGAGRLESSTAAGPAAGPLLDVRGLALLYAGAAATALLLRTGLLSEPLPALDAVFAGPRPVLLDDF